MNDVSRQHWTTADVPPMSGRTVVVTGASSGIGLSAARELAAAGAKVVLAVRDVKKGAQVADAMPGATEVRHLDLTSLDSVRRFSADWAGDLDILINNAGIMMVPEGKTADGFEMQIGTNHLGHFALTNLLLPHVTDRVVTVSSDLHKMGRMDIEDLNWESRRYRPMGAYTQSKLANLLFTLELQRRLTEAGSPVRALSAHPGVARTNLVTHVGGFQGFMNRLFFPLIQQDVDAGALPTLFAATQDIPGASYVGPDGIIHTKGYPEVSKPSRSARDSTMARKLWDKSASLTGTGFPALQTTG